jgi:hypothetical protein
MGVYIKGMEMPKEGSWTTVRIYPDGTCAVPNWQGDCTFIRGAQAVTVPSHGRCIDEKELLSGCGYIIADGMACIPVKHIANAPTIIPAEEGE